MFSENGLNFHKARQPKNCMFTLSVEVSFGDYDRVETQELRLPKGAYEQVKTAFKELRKTPCREQLTELGIKTLGEDFIPPDENGQYAQVECIKITYRDEHGTLYNVTLEEDYV